MSRNDRGEYTPRTKDGDILAYFSQGDRPFQTAQSVAEQFDFDRSQAYRRLQQLADEGELEKTKVGGRAVVWWISGDDGRVAGTNPHEVNPEDPLFDRDTFEVGEPRDTSETIDEILYGDEAPGSV